MKCRVLSIAIVLLAVGASPALAQVLNNNSYLCHKVGDEKVPAKFVPIAANFVVDQTLATTVDLKKPFLLCNPSSVNGGPIYDPALHYCCYKAKSLTKVSASYDITDQFGALRLGTKKPFLLCAPCTKAPA